MKRKGELAELRGLSEDELAKKVSDTEHELMNLRFRKAAGQLSQSSQLSRLRRTIARAKTLREERLSAERARS